MEHRALIRFWSILLAVPVLSLCSCERWFGPDREGELQLSSQRFGAETYYTSGYHYDDGAYYRYDRFSPTGDPTPDIINEAFRTLQNGSTVLLPLFSTPGETNGFALVGSFESLADARSFYKDYTRVESGLQFEFNSDTVELYQVWVQKTAADTYAKLLVKEILDEEDEGGNQFNVVVADFTYQPNGSAKFPD